MKLYKKILALSILLCMLLISSTSVYCAVDTNKFQKETSSWLVNTVKAPAVGSIGGEWAVLGLARSGATVPSGYYDNYYNEVVKKLEANNGVLSTSKYTEYSRVILALTSIGKDVTNVGGYNLLEQLSDFDNVKKQGINGPIFALIALDSHNYDIPISAAAKTQNSRQLMVDYILSLEIAGDGYSLDDKTADPDITGMALQALSKYQNQAKVKASINRCLNKLSDMQLSDGSFTSWGNVSAESLVQVITGLSALGIDSNSDSRFVKTDKDGNKHSLIDAFSVFVFADGGVRHVMAENSPNLMATEQGLYGLNAYNRMKSGKKSLYDMSDIKIVTTNPSQVQFSDIVNHWAKESILKLSNAEIINGMGDGKFQPNSSMTRAQFATILVKALNIEPSGSNSFTDCKSNAWYYDSISAAVANNLIKGKTSTKFCPNDLITREEASVIIYRATKFTGIDNNLSDDNINQLLSAFSDNNKCASWSREAIAANVKNGLLSNNSLLRPKDNIIRAEVAVIVDRLVSLIEEKKL